MKTVMTDSQFIEKLELLAKANSPYATGGFGACISHYPSQCTRYANNMYNAVYKEDKAAGKTDEYAKKDAETWANKVRKAAETKPCWCFDCVGLVKGLIWGFSFKTDSVYGGAVYKSNGLDDCGAGEGGLISECYDVSANFSNIVPGELLWLNGHVGVYVGDGMAIECTTAWDDKVQKVECWNVKKTGRGRKWAKHGKLPWIQYTEKPQEIKAEISGFKSESEKNTFLNILKQLSIK